MIARMTTLLGRPWPAGLFLGLASLLLYSINIDRAPHQDELYHILAAKGLLETGEPAIGEDGRYWRGYPLTWLVAQSFVLFEPGLVAARLPAVLFMVGLVVLLFLFLHREAGPLAAWLGAGLFAVSPFTIELAQFVRFYSLQSLLFFAGAWIVYAVVGRSGIQTWLHWRQLVAALFAVLLMAWAVRLQPTTLFGIAGLGLWACGTVLLPWLADREIPRSRKHRILLALVGLGLVGLAVAWLSGLLPALWQDYRSTSLSNRPHADQFWYYHGWYSLLYPTLWPISGILALIALTARPRLASFLLLVFAVGFLLNSFAASKNMRYIAYAQPFLFGLWGVALGTLVTGARDLYARNRERLGQCLTLLPRRLARPLATLLVIGALAFLMLANPAVLRTATLLAGIIVPPEMPPTDWDAARPVLEPLIHEVDAVVTTDDLGMLYHYGRADYLLAASKFGELPTDRHEPFGRDFRTDVPVIEDARSLELILRCHEDGLFVTQVQHWPGGQRPRAELADAAPLLYALARPLDVPPESRLVAFVWQNAAAADDPGCRSLPGFRDLQEDGLPTS